MSYQFCPSSNKNIDRLIEKPISHHLSVLGGHFSKFSASDVSGGEGRKYSVHGYIYFYHCIYISFHDIII